MTDRRVGDLEWTGRSRRWCDTSYEEEVPEVRTFPQDEPASAPTMIQVLRS